MNQTTLRLSFLLAAGCVFFVSVQAGSLEPPPGPVSPTHPPDTCFDNTGNRFVNCGDGTIKDTETGLFWLKDASCFGTLNWAAANTAVANLAHGQCGLTDGSLPGDWRLPTLACPAGSSCSLTEPPTGEFAALFAPSCGTPFILDTAGTGCWSEGNPFSGVQSHFYVSSTTYAISPSAAWYVNLIIGGVTVSGKAGVSPVWPVRGGP